MSSTEFISAVNGWKQAVGIMRQLRDGLQFTVSQINENKGAFPPSPEKTVEFEKARQALRTADSYIASMNAVMVPEPP